MSGKFVGLPFYSDDFVERANEMCAARRRLQRGDEQSVVAASGGAGDGAGGEAADAVGDEPFALFSGGEVGADFGAEGDNRGNSGLG